MKFTLCTLPGDPNPARVSDCGDYRVVRMHGGYAICDGDPYAGGKQIEHGYGSPDTLQQAIDIAEQHRDRTRPWLATDKTVREIVSYGRGAAEAYLRSRGVKWSHQRASRLHQQCVAFLSSASYRGPSFTYTHEADGALGKIEQKIEAHLTLREWRNGPVYEPSGAERPTIEPTHENAIVITSHYDAEGEVTEYVVDAEGEATSVWDEGASFEEADGAETEAEYMADEVESQTGTRPEIVREAEGHAIEVEKPVYVYLCKDSVPNPRIHRGAKRTFAWPDGSKEVRYLPACGARVDVTCLETEQGRFPEWSGDGPCKRCFPNGNEDVGDKAEEQETTALEVLKRLSAWGRMEIPNTMTNLASIIHEANEVIEMGES